MNTPIYLDNNSTTPVDPTVLEAMLPYFTTRFGNPSNTSHSLGVECADAVEHARQQVAEAIGGSARDIIFTSGATESNNLALFGICRYREPVSCHVVTTAIEHKAVLEVCRQLEQDGCRVTYLPVDRTGMVSPADVEDAITADTALVSIMAANNEVGTIQPIKDIGAICRERGVVFHSDAVQAVGRIAVDVDDWQVDLMSVSAHKLYGPKGIGALYARGGGAKLGIVPLMAGGGQERGLRPGTLPVPLIVGFGAACELAKRQLSFDTRSSLLLRQRLKDRFIAAMPDALVHGHPDRHLPGLLSIGFRDTDGDILMPLLKDVAVSQGSSCTMGSFEPSHVLRAMNIDDELIRATLRLGVGRFNTLDEIDQAAGLILTATKEARMAQASV
jgi:cysteine desulfurase